MALTNFDSQLLAFILQLLTTGSATLTENGVDILGGKYNITLQATKAS